MKIANKIIMTITGVVLLAAAVLKGHQLLTEPIISDSFWESWEFFLIQIPLELGLGIWLVSGLFRKGGWLVALISFAVFIAVTLHKGLTGAASCGCFGVVHVNPWITLFSMDVPIFVALLIFRPIGQKLLPPPWPTAKHFWAVAIPTAILLAITVPVLVFNRPPEITDRHIVVRADKADEVDENKDDAEEWFMFEHIDIADQLRSKIAVVVLYHHECSDCEEVIPHYENLCQELAGNEGALVVAFVEIPPYGPDEDSPISPETECLTGRLDSSKKWYIKTPLVVLTAEGRKVKTWEMQTPSLDEILESVFAGK